MPQSPQSHLSPALPALVGGLMSGPLAGLKTLGTLPGRARGPAPDGATT